MSQPKDTVTGTVVAVKPWKTGKGFFLNLEGDSNDYYSFGKTALEEGDTATFEVSEGTGGFADKIKLDKLVPTAVEKQQETEKTMPGVETGDKVYLTREEAQAVRQNSIERQCALKAAVQVVGELYPRQEKMDNVKIIDYVETFAVKFLAFIQDEDSPLPEPPGED